MALTVPTGYLTGTGALILIVRDEATILEVHFAHMTVLQRWLPL